MILGLHMASSIKVTEEKVIKLIKSPMSTMKLLLFGRRAWTNDKQKKLWGCFYEVLELLFIGILEKNENPSPWSLAFFIFQIVCCT